MNVPLVTAGALLMLFALLEGMNPLSSKHPTWAYATLGALLVLTGLLLSYV